MCKRLPLAASHTVQMLKDIDLIPVASVGGRMNKIADGFLLILGVGKQGIELFISTGV